MKLTLEPTAEWRVMQCGPVQICVRRWEGTAPDGTIVSALIAALGPRADQQPSRELAAAITEAITPPDEMTAGELTMQMKPSIFKAGHA